MFSAVGMGSFENVMYLMRSGASLSSLVVIAVARALTPVHAITGFFVGIGLVRILYLSEPPSLSTLLLLPLLIHGCYDFLLMAVPALPLALAMLVPFLEITILVGSTILVRRHYKRYLQDPAPILDLDLEQSVSAGDRLLEDASIPE
jgi:hypothetical protein